MDVGLVLANWIHTVAFVIAWGDYGILGRIVIPGLRDFDSSAATRTLDAIERRALPLILTAVVAFVVTGSYLLAVDDQYQGLGNLAASTWTVMLTIKHVLIVPLVALGVVIDYLIHRAGDPVEDRARRRRIFEVRIAAEAATALGAVIVLLTAIAQAS